jgi:hypothetical protein
MLSTFNLPSELIQHIFEFCIDKRLAWDKLIQQFLKGGFNRKNLRLNGYIKNQHWYAQKLWRFDRPEISGEMTQWNTITQKRELCNFDYRYGEWDIKTKRIVVTFKTRNGFYNKWSAKEPVSRWLKNIKKFETNHHEFAKEMYLPEVPCPIKVKGVSKFYVDLRANNKIKKRKEKKRNKENRAASLFMKERRQLKINKCNFKQNQEVLLSFTMSSSGKLKFYKGYVQSFHFHQHRGGNGYRLIFSAPRGVNRLDPLKIDNYIGEVKITIKFEDGEKRQYTHEKLAERVKISTKEKNTQDKLINEQQKKL